MARMRKGRTPSREAIRAYWAEQGIWQGKFISQEEFLDTSDDELGHGACFACAWIYEHGLERAHILSDAAGGTQTVDNLHLLCRYCHRDSEWLSGDAYWQWFRKRTIE